MAPSDLALHQDSRPTAAQREWISSTHTARPVLNLLDSLGWRVVTTPEANVHCTSPDGLGHVSWLPEDRTAWERDIVFRVQVSPTDGGAPWVQQFSTATPAEAVAGFLAALVTVQGHAS